MILDYMELFTYLAISNLIPRIASVSSALFVLLVSLSLIFAGRFVIRIIAFFGVGIVLAAAAASVGAIILGVVGLVIGGIIGFVVGGFLSFVLLPLAIGVASGLVAYDLTQGFVHIYPISVIVGVFFFILGVLLSMKLLSLATVVFGSLLLFDSLIFFHFPLAIALIVSVLMGLVGFWVQDGFEKNHRTGHQFVGWSKRNPPASAVPINPSTSTRQAVRYCSQCGSEIDNPATKFCPNCGTSLD
ncbi:MAG TPA: zinc ribbon domain-containing protein [Nitrososphaerales archaeon]|nr:zinc ribbon domain-containing protein [Nitrososphaerales archaeon]